MTLLRGDWFYIWLVFLDSFFMTRPYLYAIQQDNYRIGEIFKSKRLRFVYFVDFCAIVIFIGFWLVFYFLQAKAFWGFLIVLFFFITEFALYFMEDLPDRKKPLKYTKRAVRCLIFVSIFSTVVVGIAMSVATAHMHDLYLRYLVFFAFPLAFPLIFVISTAIINIFERLNCARYEKMTTKYFASQTDMKRIAITGSCGKTSVKNFLDVILSQKYNVLATPSSYNTPMGISKTVENMDGTYDFFVAEFGARRVGDIKKLMKIVKPQYSILTAINSQHLKTFGSEDNIRKEKCRILDINGVCVANYKLKGIIESMAQKRKNAPEIVYAGLDDRADVYAKNVYMNRYGSDFELVVGNETFAAHTKLVGIHNIEDIVLASAMAISLDVEIELVLAGIAQIQPVPHRMELVEGNGILIVDDSFNSNPDGAKYALETLSFFEGRKVVMTPGLVELGEQEYEQNRLLGERISHVADVVMIIGKSSGDAILKGMKENNFCGDIYRFSTLQDAENEFKNVLHFGDVFLILNDLPEYYEDTK